MSIVEIVIDPAEIETVPEGAMLVTSSEQYVGARLRARDALHGGPPAVLYVRDKVIGSWLRACDAYGERTSVRVCTPRTELERRWGLTIPSDVTDTDILRDGLLSGSTVPREGQDFYDVILDHFYGPSLSFSAFPTDQPESLTPLAERYRQTASCPLALRAFNRRMDQWDARAPKQAVRNLVHRLRVDPPGLVRDFAKYHLLRGYPDAIGKRVLGDLWDIFQQAQVATENVTLEGEPPVDVVHAVEYYLTATKPSLTSPSDVLALLRQVSGCLRTEFQAMRDTLHTHPDWITASLVADMERKFHAIDRQLRGEWATLRRSIRPAFPQEPDNAWNADQWLDWIRYSYMPYYAWQEEQPGADDLLAAYASTFADWFYANFVALKNSSPQHFAFSALYRNRDRVQAENAVTLVLLVDNLNFVHFEELVRLFQANGLMMQSSRAAFSLIPTATEVGKAALIAGRGDQVDQPEVGYPALVEQEWGSVLKSGTAAYLSSLGELQKMEDRTASLYFLNYLPIDKELHEDWEQTGRTHAEAIHGLMETLAESVANFAHRFGLEDNLAVYVVSDHGSTRISSGAVNILDKAYYGAIADKKHHRYVALSDKDFQSLPQVVEAQCYAIPSSRFNTKRNYLAARGQYRFSDTTDRFYVHGGLTPEEVVVPFARFAFAEVKPIPLTIHVPDTQFRYSVKSQIKLVIGNPNDFAVENITVRLFGTAADEAIVERLDPKQELPTAISTVFQRIPGEKRSRTLGLRIHYLCQGRVFTADDYSFEVTLKSMMEVPQDDFDL